MTRIEIILITIKTFPFVYATTGSVVL